MNTFEDIYNLFKSETDGEEFDSDDDAIMQGNIAYAFLRSMRNWKILKKAVTISITSTTYLLTSITDLDNYRVVSLWDGDYELKKATLEQRKDSNYDYWIDFDNNSIKFINSFTGKSLELVYIYKPDDMEVDGNGTVFGPTFNPIISYKMILDFKEKDADPTFYQSIEKKYQTALNLLIDYNESL